MTAHRLAPRGPTWLPVYERRLWGWWLELAVELTIFAATAWWLVGLCFGNEQP
jgi:hypothetical protein